MPMMAPSATAAPPALSVGAMVPSEPPTVLQRTEHDAFMRRHLIVHASPHTYQATMAAAVLFRARARLAKKAVAQRAQRGLHGGTVAGSSSISSPSRVEREHQMLVARMSREERIDEGVHLLHQRAANIEVRVLKMEDDGNCQFRALAHELYGDARHHEHVRSVVVAHLRSRAAEFAFYVGDDGEWAEYLSKMSVTRTWGDELTLRAASEAYGCAVHVVTTEPENWLLHYGSCADCPIGSAAGSVQRDVFLCYVSPIHYNVIEPLLPAEMVRRRHAARVLQQRQRNRSSRALPVS